MEAVHSSEFSVNIYKIMWYSDSGVLKDI